VVHLRQYAIAALLLLGCSVDGRYVDLDAAVGTDADVPDAAPGSPDAAEPSLYVFTSEVKMTGLLSTSQSAESVAADSGRVYLGTPVYQTPSIAGGAVGVFVKSGSWLPSTTLAGIGQSNDAHFGRDITIRGDTMIVTADEHEKNGIYRGGAIFAFNRRGAAWEQTAILSAVNARSTGIWGRDATTDGARILAGLPYSDRPNMGEIDIFEKVGSEWVQAPPIFVPGGFGQILATEGDVIVTGGVDQVMFLGKSKTTWTETSRLSGTAGSDFGARVLLRDGLLFVAAPNEAGVGAVYVYEVVEGSWTERARLSPIGGDTTNGKFGAAIDYVAGSLVVGAPDTNSRTGAVYLFERTGGSWFQHPRLTALNGAEGDRFGGSVAIAGDGANFVVGALKRQSGYVYERVVR
jgi:hypothetical protein